ncbi:PIN domain-containing protein [Palleronia caenipelagi]|nr:PIN domain-containing protein [Palleronia caenipelagi]
MLRLIIDTNLFHEFRPLEELPWAELGELDYIELIVTDVVQTELDEHKKSTRARMKRTAIKITKQFRDMLLAHESELEIRASGPRVVLSLSDVNFGSETYGTLDLNNFDDQLVAIAKRLSDNFKDGSVHLFSNDTRPMRKAVGLGLNLMAIPEEWRRSDEKTDEEKERSRLAYENKRRRSQEPIIKLTSDPAEPLHLNLPIYAPLSDDEIDHFMDLLTQRNPKETNFAIHQPDNPVAEQFGGVSLGITQYEFEEAPPNDVEAYLWLEYPQWETDCREKLQHAHIHLTAFGHEFAAAFLLSNTGTRPAADVLLTIAAKGALLVMPPLQNDKDDFEDEPITGPLIFPSAPKAPQGKWNRRLRTILDLRAFKDNFGPTHILDIDTDLMTSVPRIDNPYHFYYQDRPSTYVKTFTLTCDQFRHAGKPEVFECMCHVDGRAKELDGKNAVVEIKIEASNLSDPVSHKLIVRFGAEHRSTFKTVSDILHQGAL